MQVQWQWSIALLVTVLAVGSGELFPARPPIPPDRPPSPISNGTPFREDSADKYRLQSHIKPEHYDIIITPQYLKESPIWGIEKFQGEVTIVAEVEEDTGEIELNSKGIRFNGVKVFEEKGTSSIAPPTTAPPTTAPPTTAPPTTAPPTTAPPTTAPPTTAPPTTAPPTTAPPTTAPPTTAPPTTAPPTTAPPTTAPPTTAPPTTVPPTTAPPTTAPPTTAPPTTAPPTTAPPTTAPPTTAPPTTAPPTTAPPTTAPPTTAPPTTAPPTTAPPTTAPPTTAPPTTAPPTTAPPTTVPPTTAPPTTAPPTTAPPTTAPPTTAPPTTAPPTTAPPTTAPPTTAPPTTAPPTTAPPTTAPPTTTPPPPSSESNEELNDIIERVSEYRSPEVIKIEKNRQKRSLSLDDASEASNSYIKERASANEIAVVHKEDEEFEKLIITREDTKQFVKGSRILIKITYEAEFNRLSGGTGFYVIEHEIENKKTAILATQFEATYARQAFPCFDEPALKATFSLSIAVQDGVRAISNMEEEKTENKIIKFKTTPKMSTYLLAFIVYEIDSYKSAKSDSFQTWGRSELINGNQGEYSQNFGPKMLSILSSWTDIGYDAHGINKMDQAAVPGKGGAMENWGLVIYGESALLVDGASSSEAEKKRVLDVMAHELAHQWFGNLVTTEWWDSIWLNEGFANYFQYVVMHERDPTWRMDERFVVDEQMRVFAVDAQEDAWPLTLSVSTPQQISDHFGTITYSKGGSILRQIKNVLGEESFQKAIQNYLKKRQFESATPDHLFNAFLDENNETSTNVNSSELNNILHEWTTKEGYPVVKVVKMNDHYRLVQERFLLKGTDERNLTYPIHLTWMTNDKTQGKQWLQHGDMVDVGKHEWVMFNHDQSGYYRVNYPDDMWRKLSNELMKKQVRNIVSPLDRAALVDNALNLARAGKLDYEVAFFALRFLNQDMDFLPWASARNALSYVERMMGREDSYKNFLRFLLNEVYEEVGFDKGKDDDHIKLVHRVNVLSLACAAGYKDTPELAKAELDELLDEDDSQSSRTVSKDPNTQALIYCYGLKKDDGTTWNKMYEKYQTENDKVKRSFYISSLGCINNGEVLKDFLSKSLNDSEIEKGEAASVFSSVTNNPDGVVVALDFLKDNKYEGLELAYGNSVNSALNGLATRLTSNDEVKKFNDAIKGHEENFKDSLSTAQENIEWLKTNKKTVEEALKKATGNGCAGLAASVLTLFLAALLTFIR